MVINLANFETWVPLLAGVGVTYLVAWLTKQHATGTTKALISFALLVLTSFGMWLADTGVSHTWIGAASAFVLAAISAAVSRKTLTEGTVIGPDRLAAATANFGIGGSHETQGH